MKAKTKLFSVTKDDFTMQTFACGGKGGAGKDTGNSGVRLIHKESGAVGEGREERHQYTNKRRAFLRCIETPKFKSWFQLEIAKRSGAMAEIEARVEEWMDPKYMKVETYEAN